MIFLCFLWTLFICSSQGQDIECLPTEVTVQVKDYFQWHYYCQKICPYSQFVYRKKCYDACPLNTAPKENGFIKYCASDFENFTCPDSICQKEYPYCFNDICLDACPEYTVGYRKSCVLNCPPDAKFVTAYSCDGVCYSGNKKCSSECPESHPFVFKSKYLYHCLNKCPSFTAVNNRKCELSCPLARPYLHSGRCLSKCPLTHPFAMLRNSLFNEILVCTDRCHEGMGSYKNACVSICPSKSPNEYHGKCVSFCGKDRPYVNTTPSKKSTIYHQQCVAKCPKEKNLWTERNECVSKCPETTIFFNDTCVTKCPSDFPLNYTKEKHDKIKHECVERCPVHTFQYKTLCFDTCPPYLKHYLSNCTLNCPKAYPFISSDNVSCVQSCPASEVYSENKCDKSCSQEKKYIVNKTCFEFCPDAFNLQLETQQGILCLKPPCPHSFVLLEWTNQCVRSCPKNMFIIDDVCRNVSTCPNGTFTEKSSHGTLCTEKCSNSLYINGNMCIKKCPSHTVIEDQHCNNNCSGTKPYRFPRGSDYDNPAILCVSECPDGYCMYQNKCISCDECQYHQQVVYKNLCVDSCPPTYVINSNYICFYNSYYLHRGLQAMFFLFTIICVFFIIVLCCYRGPLKCSRKSPEEEQEDSASLIKETEENQEA